MKDPTKQQKRISIFRLFANADVLNASSFALAKLIEKLRSTCFGNLNKEKFERTTKDRKKEIKLKNTNNKNTLFMTEPNELSSLPLSLFKFKDIIGRSRGAHATNIECTILTLLLDDLCAGRGGESGGPQLEHPNPVETAPAMFELEYDLISPCSQELQIVSAMNPVQTPGVETPLKKVFKTNDSLNRKKRKKYKTN